VIWQGEAIGDGVDLGEALEAYAVVAPEVASWE
jgi:hypothetical protein